MNIAAYLKKQQQLIDDTLQNALPPSTTRPAILHEAMRYCVLNGGKRIRPILCLATAEMLGVPTKEALKPSAAVELYHCSTLVHDDLPCMDNDELRRGQPTCHVKFGSANAVLTGDALMIQAFELLAECGHANLVKELAQSAGSRGVIAGQVEDLAAESQPPSADLIEFIHTYKTAILIRSAVRIGALLGNADPESFQAINRFGETTGLAFQIADDILDVTSTDQVLGKPAGSDAAQHKLTYPLVHGMDASIKRVEELTQEAIASLQPLDYDTDTLQALAEHLMCREY